jgi:hypothetical protein
VVQLAYTVTLQVYFSCVCVCVSVFVFVFVVSVSRFVSFGFALAVLGVWCAVLVCCCVAVFACLRRRRSVTVELLLQRLGHFFKKEGTNQHKN